MRDKKHLSLLESDNLHVNIRCCFIERVGMIIIGMYPDQIAGGIKKLNKMIDVLFPREVVVHLLPFQISCGDGGFAINDWYTVDPQFGSWKDIENWAINRKIIVDGVFNHIGIEHNWVTQFQENPDRYKEYFFVNQNLGLKSPRGQKADCEIQTTYGPMYIRQTHMDKTIDINLENPVVCKKIQEYLYFLKNRGIWGIRLDAVSYYKKGALIRHNVGAQQLANKIADIATNQGFHIMAQVDCDQSGRCYFSDDKHTDIAIYDFSFSALLCEALARGYTKKLADHLNETSKLNRLLVRAPRTHDGILLRSGCLDEICKKNLVDFSEKNGIKIRSTQGTYYELNCSMPYFLKKIYAKDMYQIINLTIVFTGILNSIPYYYLPYILGVIPEESSINQDIPIRFQKDDPRTLNRLPINEKNFDFPFEKKKKLIEIFKQLNILHQKKGNQILKGNAIYEAYNSIIKVSVANGQIIGYFNFSSSPKNRFLENDKKEYLFMSSNDEESLEPYGYKIYVYN